MQLRRPCPDPHPYASPPLLASMCVSLHSACSKVRQTVEREFRVFLGNVQRVVAESISAHYESQEAAEEKERLAEKRMRLLEILVEAGKARAKAVAAEEAQVRCCDECQARGGCPCA